VVEGYVHPEHEVILSAALKNHPKMIHLDMLKEGMRYMGVEPTPAALTRLMEVAQTNPQQFHTFAKKARSHYFMAKDAQANRVNRQRAQKGVK